MPNSTNLLDAFGGLTLLAIGAPGTGKSYLLGSVGEFTRNVAVLCPKPTEANSWLYKKYDLKPEIFTDPKWKPTLGLFEADGYSRLLRRLVELYDDPQVDAVIIDPLTDAVSLASHDLLKGEKVDSPKSLRDPLGYWDAIRRRMQELVQTAVGLAYAPKPKHVLVSVHARPINEEDIKGKETQEGKAKGVRFFGEVLPMVEGSYRHDIAGEFDLVCYTNVKHETVREGNRYVQKTRYIVEMTADSDKHGKARIAPALSERELDNNLRAILDAVQKTQKAAEEVER